MENFIECLGFATFILPLANGCNFILILIASTGFAVGSTLGDSYNRRFRETVAEDVLDTSKDNLASIFPEITFIYVDKLSNIF